MLHPRRQWEKIKSLLYGGESYDMPRRAHKRTSMARGKDINEDSYRPLAMVLLHSAFLIPSVFAGKVDAWKGKDIDFSRYKAYEWLPPRVLTRAGVVEDHPANPAVREAVGRQLSQRGLNRSD